MAVLNRLARVAVETEGASLSGMTAELTSTDASSVTVACFANNDELEGKLAELAASAIVYVYASGSQRVPWAVKSSSHEFEILKGDDAAVYEDFRRLIRVLRCPPAPCLGPGECRC